MLNEFNEKPRQLIINYSQYRSSYVRGLLVGLMMKTRTLDQVDNSIQELFDLAEKGELKYENSRNRYTT